MRGLSGRVAFVTGGGAGIGAALAARFVDEGVRVAVVDRDQSAALAVARGLEGAIGLEADVADATAIRAAIAATVDAFGALHIVVSNAGIIRPAMLAKMDADDFSAVLEIHVKGTFHTMQAALPHLPEDGTGRIINSTSAAGLVGTIGQINYSAAKAAILGMTKSGAKELAKRQITVNAVAPLAVTAMTEKIRTDEKLAKLMRARIPMGRFAEPEEVVGTFAFLASDDASYITGQTICVDGGTVI
ncbi:SDR family oxidoreductase [Paraconexibacter antarcticus]|uniref:SDR family oxidoreductase n=1 Tax=Paraconexibacter antarcticus TaxID=2949664 RepID=A0ABY5E031_9ACTN|nr:SDR family NAD(P)-dependent oxidoreductase [Paraconexibacter antarcticus]UTI66195.1 SDR family oxidoreductase [Paraconexibacter antarcticus]